MSSNPAQKMKFFSYHNPPMHKGNYLVSATQTFGSTGKGKKAIADDLFGHSLTLSHATTFEKLPKTGVSTVVVANVNLPDKTVALHFRIFDAKGQIARDTPQAELSARQDDCNVFATKLAPYYKTAPTEKQTHDLLGEIARLLGVRFETERSFTVGGERFALNPQQVMAVFPPEGSAGDHANVLPHVIVRRSTLPWERYALAGIPDPKATPRPWIALLTFDDGAEDTPAVKAITLGTYHRDGNQFQKDKLYQDNTVSCFHEHAANPEAGEADDQPVRVIDISQELAKAVLPLEEELPYLAHVRQPEDAYGASLGHEHGVVFGTRLPTRGKQSVVHLVSLEHRYLDKKFWVDTSKGDDGKPKDVRLVVLKTWQFRCLDEASYLISQKIADAVKDPATKTFVKEKNRKLIAREVVGEPDFRKELDGLTEDQIAPLLTQARYKKLNFKTLLMELKGDALRLPATALAGPVDATAQSLLDQSYVLLPHRLRNAGKSAAFYRGPLTGGGVIVDGDIPVTRAADHLLRQEQTTGAIDASYAAAWQLGRMMMLSSKTVSLALFTWKRVHAQWVKSIAQRLAHLPFNRLSGSLEVPPILRNWLYDTALLKGVPFGHLVPDPDMLPQETIRYFQVDPLWIEALLDGAFSIGRVNTGDQKREANLAAEQGKPSQLARDASNWSELPTGAVEGVIVRSEVVAGWPHLQADGVSFVGPAHAIALNTTLDDLLETLSGGKLNVSTPLPEVCRDMLVNCGLTMPILSDCELTTIGLSLHNKSDRWVVREVGYGDPRVLCHIECNGDPDAKPIKDADPDWSLDVILPSLRVEHLAKGVLLCLFQGRIDAVDLHLKPEAVHFGVGEPDPEHPETYKELRHWDGREDPDAIIENIPFREPILSPQSKNIIDIKTLAQSKISLKGMPKILNMNRELTPAEFALQMVEGVARVRFTRLEALSSDKPDVQVIGSVTV